MLVWCGLHSPYTRKKIDTVHTASTPAQCAQQSVYVRSVHTYCCTCARAVYPRSSVFSSLPPGRTGTTPIATRQTAFSVSFDFPSTVISTPSSVTLVSSVCLHSKFPVLYLESLWTHTCGSSTKTFPGTGHSRNRLRRPSRRFHSLFLVFCPSQPVPSPSFLSSSNLSRLFQCLSVCADGEVAVFCLPTHTRAEIDLAYAWVLREISVVRWGRGGVFDPRTRTDYEYVLKCFALVFSELWERF